MVSRPRLGAHSLALGSVEERCKKWNGEGRRKARRKVIKDPGIATYSRWGRECEREALGVAVEALTGTSDSEAKVELREQVRVMRPRQGIVAHVKKVGRVVRTLARWSS